MASLEEFNDLGDSDEDDANEDDHPPEDQGVNPEENDDDAEEESSLLMSGDELIAGNDTDDITGDNTIVNSFSVAYHGEQRQHLLHNTSESGKTESPNGDS